MLIASRRHTVADRRWWAELEECDLRHASTMAFHRRAGHALAAIRRFAATGSCYAAVSWGKDSTALAGLVAESGVTVPMAWVRVEPIVNPDCAVVRDTFLSRHQQLQYIEITVNCTRDESGWHATGTLERGIDEVHRRLGTDRCLLGIRAEESSARRISARRFGIETASRCRPLLWWSADDVYAYLASRRLPVHPAYGCTGGGRWDRERIRVASLGGRRGDGIGRTEWEREYYGDELCRLA